MRKVRAAERAVRDRVAEYISHGVEPGYADIYLDDLDQIIESPTLTRTVLPPDATVEDRMPKGAYTVNGPEDGISTTIRDLQSTLDENMKKAASHEWFRDNPHWAYGVNGDGDPELVELVRTWEKDHV